MQNTHTLPIKSLNWNHFRERFMAAINRRIGSRPGQLPPFDAAEALGCHYKTVEGWLYFGAEPGAANLRKMFLLWGESFINEVFDSSDCSERDGATVKALALGDIMAIRKSASDTVAALDAVLAPEPDPTVVSLAQRGRA